MHSAKHHYRRGFTLTEVLVTILIIAVLAVFAFAGVRMFKARAHQSTCMSNMRQLGVAIQGFIGENGRYPTPLRDPANWDRMLLPYLTDSSMDFTAGRINPVREGTDEAGALGKTLAVFNCPADSLPPPQGQFRRNYTMCNWTVNQRSPEPGGWNNGWSHLPNGGPVPPVLVSEPHRAVMMVEFWTKKNRPSHTVGSDHYSTMFGFRPMPQDPNPANYHGKNQHVLFVDGHIGTCPGNITQRDWEAKGYSPHRVP